MLSTPPHLANLQNPSLKQIDSRFQNLDKLANLDKQSKKKQTPAIYRLRHMEVAEKTPEARTTGRLGAASGAGGVQRGSRDAPPCELLTWRWRKKTPEARTTRRLGVASGTGGVQRGSRAAPPCECLQIVIYRKRDITKIIL